MKKVIIYEELNIFTFLCAVLGNTFFVKQYFIDFKPFLKKYFFQSIKKMGLKQIHHVDLLGRGVQPETSKRAIEIANKLFEYNPNMAKSFIHYLSDQRAESLMRQLFVLSLYKATYRETILTRFVTENNDSLVYYFPVTKNFIIDSMQDISKDVIVVRWHRIILHICRIMKNLICLLGLILAPIILFLELITKGNITLKKNKYKIFRKAIFAHHDQTLKKDSNVYKIMYLFNSGILKIADCVHICLHKTPLLPEKINYLRREGGEVFDYPNQKVPIACICKRLFIDYYKCFFSYLYLLAFNRFSSFSLTRSVVATIRNTIRLEMLFEQVDGRLAFFESEIGTILSLFTLIANKHNIETMTMLHGHGGYCAPDHNRANTVTNYYIVPGNYYNRYLKPYSPHVDKFCPVGSHELEDLDGKDRGLPEEIKHKINKLRENNFKIIGMLVYYYWPFFPGSNWWPLFDYNSGGRAFLNYWQPFFKWARQADNLFFIFKGKATYKEYESPFVKEVLSEIPEARYYQNDSLSVKDIILASDCTVCSAGSSVFYSSLCLGVPAVTYDLTFTGYMIDRKYEKDTVARTADGLIDILTRALEGKMPRKLFEEIRKKHHVEDGKDKSPSSRIKRLMEEIIER